MIAPLEPPHSPQGSPLSVPTELGDCCAGELYRYRVVGRRRVCPDRVENPFAVSLAALPDVIVFGRALQVYTTITYLD